MQQVQRPAELERRRVPARRGYLRGGSEEVWQEDEEEGCRNGWCDESLAEEGV